MLAITGEQESSEPVARITTTCLWTNFRQRSYITEAVDTRETWSPLQLTCRVRRNNSVYTFVKTLHHRYRISSQLPICDLRDDRIRSNTVTLQQRSWKTLAVAPISTVFDSVDLTNSYVHHQYWIVAECKPMRIEYGKHYRYSQS